jgi:hypothetical protein
LFLRLKEISNQIAKVATGTEVLAETSTEWEAIVVNLAFLLAKLKGLTSD